MLVSTSLQKPQFSQLLNFSQVRSRVKLPHYLPANRYKMDATEKDYIIAVDKLNELQRPTMKLGKKQHEGLGLIVMKEFLNRTNITDSDVEKMKIIHISGTKGKGSTCAFVESILRHSGFSTGFYSSPHLLEVRERIRINGKPISREKFAKYFWKVHELLDATQHDYTVKMPSYFYFLTTMAFFTFKCEAVDAVIMEVGLGGAYDSTNVIKNPVACGVTSIGFDHVGILGDSLESIAWHKSGIFKKNTRAFTIQQPEKVLEVMHERARATGSNLNVIPDLSRYWEQRNIHLGIAGEHQRLNASLAVQLAHCWIYNEPLMTPLSLNSSFTEGLKSCQWNGRTQTLKMNNITFYMDGAHTKQSMAHVAKWFSDEASKEEAALEKTCSKVLIFNVIGDRSAQDLLSILRPINFDYAMFTPNVATFSSSCAKDQTDLKHPTEVQMKRAVLNREEWVAINSCDSDVSFLLHPSVFPSAADAICCLTNERDEMAYQKYLTKSFHMNLKPILLGNHLQVLVTGSLHLVGAYLSILTPDLNF